MAVINTNVKALFSQMALGSSGRAQTVAMQQLSTGKRINSARDDAAGMAIATRMTHQIRSLNQAVRNAGDAINLIQTAEGATNEITDMMQRMRELAIQAVNDTNDNAQRSYLDLEFQQLKQQMVQIAEQTQWNGFPVLTGEAGERVGEMPVFKAISNSQFGEVFVSPTTKREVSGVAAGETQVFKLTDAAADGDYSITVGASQPITVNVNGANNMTDVLQQLKTGIAQKIDVDSINVEKAPQINKVELPGTLVAGTFKVADVDVVITADDITSAQNYGRKVKETLELKGFSATDGRNVALDPDTGALTITFGRNETPATVAALFVTPKTATGSGFSASVVQEPGYQISLTFNDSQIDPATGLAPVVVIDPPATGGPTFTPATAEFKSAVTTVDESWGSVDGAFIQSGALSMNMTSTGQVVAEFTDSRNNTIPLVGVLHPTTGKVTFSVDQGRNREVMTRDLSYTLSTADGQTSSLALGLRDFKVSVDVRGGIPAMAEGDMLINGVPIGQSYAKDDTLSPPGNAAGSAIAKAAAINRKAVSTGVATGETQTLTLTGAPLAADLPRDISVAGVTVRLTDRDNTTSAVAAAIATQLQASSLFAQNTGRVVSYQPGSTMITVKFSENEGDVASMAIDKLPTGVAPLVQTTVQHLTSTEGTGVFAKVNENIFTGQAMTGTSVVHGVVMVNGYTENDATDIHYREGAYKNFILEVGRKDELGKLAMIAPYVLMKRQNLSDFSRYNEMYGIDLRVYEYDPLKPGAREESVKSAKEFGSAAYIVVPKGMAQVLFPNNTNKQASAFAFDKLHEICNNEMTLGILGQGLTTGGQNGGSYGLGKVQKTVEEEINMEDRLIAEYIINYQFKKNILLPHGYPVEKSKGSFKLQDELPKELKANMWVTLSKNGLAIAEEDFYNEFGIPFPDGRPVVVSPSPGGMPPPTPPEGEGNVPPSQPQGGAGGKKQSKLSSSLSAYYKAKCQHDKSPMRVTLSYKSELDTLIERIIKQLQTGELKPGDVDPALYNLTAEELWKGVQKGMGVTLESATGSDYGMLKALRTNVYVFSGFKNYQFIKEASSLLVDAEGKVKPFSAFRDDVLQLNSQYNVEYLRTEYNYAVSSAQMAGKWQRIQDDKGTLPMLQYITVGDARVRAAHAALDGIIKPVDDEFWNEFYPPNSWNCRCTVKQLADGEVTETKKDKLPQLAPMFKMNSGKQAVIFPATHPVYDIDPADQKSADKNFGLDIPD